MGALAVVIRRSVEGHDRLEVWRLKRGCCQLDRSVVGDTDHPDPAIAPLLLGGPLDDVVAVPGLVLRHPAPVDAGGLSGSPDISDDMDVAGIRQVIRVAGFDLTRIHG
jgi:hypothetical protein